MGNDQVDKPNARAIELGRRVKELRGVLGLTQAQLAERLAAATKKQWHQTMVTKMEAGSRPTTFDELYALADALESRPRDFLDDLSEEDLENWRIRIAEQRVDALELEMERLDRQREALQQERDEAKAEVERLVNLTLFDAGTEQL